MVLMTKSISAASASRSSRFTCVSKLFFPMKILYPQHRNGGRGDGQVARPPGFSTPSLDDIARLIHLGDSRNRLPANSESSDPRESSAADIRDYVNYSPPFIAIRLSGTDTEGILLQPCVVVTGFLAGVWHTSIKRAHAAFAWGSALQKVDKR
jgi:hypothetical protein